MKALLEAIEASSVAVWDYDIPRGRIWLSAEWSYMLGYGRVSGETKPEFLIDLVPHEERETLANTLRDALVGKRDHYRIEHRVKGRHGLVWILSAGRVVERDAAGRAVHMVGTNADITQIKEAEAAVRVKKEQLRLIMDAAPALFAYFDKDLRFRFHNKAYEELCGVRPDAVDGHHVREVIGEEAFSQTEAYARRALSGECVEFERTQSKARGAKIDLSARFVPHRDADGQVAGYVAVLVDITHRKEVETRLAALALTDPLTGLPNRRTLEDRLSQAIPLAIRRNVSLALLYLDLDGFKPVNDALGHQAGDAVLSQIAIRLGALVRKSDTVARIGGDEFVVMLMDVASRDIAAQKATQLIEAVREPMLISGNRVSVGVSVGIALSPEHGNTPADLMRSADAAMYAAKSAGRGTWRMFGPKD